MVITNDSLLLDFYHLIQKYFRIFLNPKQLVQSNPKALLIIVKTFLIFNSTLESKNCIKSRKYEIFNEYFWTIGFLCGVFFECIIKLIPRYLDLNGIAFLALNLKRFNSLNIIFRILIFKKLSIIIYVMIL